MIPMSRYLAREFALRHANGADIFRLPDPPRPPRILQRLKDVPVFRASQARARPARAPDRGRIAWR
jgi:hypothetical protein